MFTFSCLIIECTVYLCDFHREQAWERWVRTAKHKVITRSEEVLSRLRRIARAATAEDFNIEVRSLKESDLWKADSSAQLRKWFESKWMSEYKVTTTNILVLN